MKKILVLAASVLTVNLAFAEEYVNLNIMRRWWLPSVNDHMDTSSATESPPGGIPECANFYVPATSTNRQPLYRLAGGADHMASNIAGEGGYTTESILGYTYFNNAPGLAPVNRWYYPPTGDHLIATPNENLPGWIYENNRGFAYPRYGCTDYSPLQVNGNEITLTANNAIGGAVVGLTWNGKQFVNNWD